METEATHNLSQAGAQRRTQFLFWDYVSTLVSAGGAYLAAAFFFRKPGFWSAAARNVSALAGAAAAYLFINKEAERTSDGRHPLSTLPEAQPMPFTFPGFSLTCPPSPGTEARFMAQAGVIAGQPARFLAFQAIAGELAQKGFSREASLLGHHIAAHGNQPFYRALDNWLITLATRSPETFEHIKRQSVLMALTAQAFTQDLPPTQRDAFTLRTLIAASAHDIGKLAIDPRLLHKSTRVERGELEAQIAEYWQKVPDYPEKARDVEFIRMINGGRIPLDTTSKATGIYSVADIMKQVNDNPLLGEPDFANNDLKASCNAHFERIKQEAIKYGLTWRPDAEEAITNRGRRGTLTADECKIMCAHDDLGVAMLGRLPMPAELALEPAVINMNKDGGVGLAARPDLAVMRQWILLADMFEAVTGQRAYNRENGKNLTPTEAVQVIEQAAKNGYVQPNILEQFKAAGLPEKYGALYSDIPKERSKPQTVVKAATTQSLDKVAPGTAQGIAV